MNAVRQQIQAQSGRSTVLIVEDDAVIRRPLAEYLQAVGYRVVEAGSAADAVALLAGGVRVDLIFSDIRMPGAMDGLDLARWIRRHHPGVWVMLTSGGSAARAANGVEVFIPKPYQAAHVAARIGQLLATAPERSEGRVPAPTDLRPRPATGQPKRAAPATEQQGEPGNRGEDPS